MRPVRVVGLYFLVVFLGASLLSPWIYWLVQGLNHVLPLAGLAAKPFPRYFNRALLILALVGLVPLLRGAGLGSWREIGLVRRWDAGTLLGWGFALGLLSLACVVAVVVGCGGRQLDPDLRAVGILSHLGQAMLTAMIVAPLEEIFFRGALMGSLRKSFHWTVALVISSLVYAWLHFLESPAWAGKVSWLAGFSVLGAMFSHMTDPANLIPGLFNLTLVGLILGLAYQRSGSLHFSIGLHAGWIFWLKTYGFITMESGANRAWLFGTGKLINGWLAFLMLVLFLALLSRLMGRPDTQSGWRERRLFS